MEHPGCYKLGTIVAEGGDNKPPVWAVRHAGSEVAVML